MQTGGLDHIAQQPVECLTESKEQLVLSLLKINRVEAIFIFM